MRGDSEQHSGISGAGGGVNHAHFNVERRGRAQHVNRIVRPPGKVTGTEGSYAHVAFTRERCTQECERHILATLF